MQCEFMLSALYSENYKSKNSNGKLNTKLRKFII